MEISKSTMVISQETKLPHEVRFDYLEQFEFKDGSYVYFLRCKKSKLFKIGVTTNLYSRIKQLAVKFPYDLELYASINGACYDMEQDIHARLKRHRLNGEWFHGNGCLLAIKDILLEFNICNDCGFSISGKYNDIFNRWVDMSVLKDKRMYEKYCLENGVK